MLKTHVSACVIACSRSPSATAHAQTLYNRTFFTFKPPVTCRASRSLPASTCSASLTARRVAEW